MKRACYFFLGTPFVFISHFFLLKITVTSSHLVLSSLQNQPIHLQSFYLFTSFLLLPVSLPPPHADLWPPRPLPAHLLSAWGLHDRVYALSMVVVLVWTTFIWVNVHNVHFWELLHDQDRFFPLKFPKCGKYLSAWRDQIYADWKCCTVFFCLISYFKDYVIQKRKVSKKLFINFLSSLFNRAVHKVWVSLSLSLCVCVCV